MKKARVCGLKVGGHQVLRVPVLVRQSWLDREYQEQSAWIEVLAHSVVDAVNLVRDEVAPFVKRPTELLAWGVRGGEVHRFIGWDSIVGAQLEQVGAWRQQVCMI